MVANNSLDLAEMPAGGSEGELFVFRMIGESNESFGRSQNDSHTVGRAELGEADLSCSDKKDVESLR